MIKVFYVVDDRSKGGKWSQCSTYDTHAGALERLRHEARSIGYSEMTSPVGCELVFLNSSRLKTSDGYEMRIERIEVSA